MGYIFHFTPDLLTQPKELCHDALFTSVTGLCNTPTGLAQDINAARQHSPFIQSSQKIIYPIKLCESQQCCIVTAGRLHRIMSMCGLE